MFEAGRKPSRQQLQCRDLDGDKGVQHRVHNKGQPRERVNCSRHGDEVKRPTPRRSLRFRDPLCRGLLLFNLLSVLLGDVLNQQLSKDLKSQPLFLNQPHLPLSLSNLCRGEQQHLRRSAQQ